MDGILTHGDYYTVPTIISINVLFISSIKDRFSSLFRIIESIVVLPLTDKEIPVL